MIELVGGEYKQDGFCLHFREWSQPGIKMTESDAKAAMEALARAHGWVVKVNRPKKPSKKHGPYTGQKLIDARARAAHATAVRWNRTAVR
jgi:hypothetical protein